MSQELIEWFIAGLEDHRDEYNAQGEHLQADIVQEMIKFQLIRLAKVKAL